MALIEVYQGSTKNVPLFFTTDAGDPMNISGYTGLFIAKRYYIDSTGDAIINKPISVLGNGTTGYANLYLSTGDTTNCSQIYIAGITMYGISGDVNVYETDGLAILPSPLGG